VTINKKMKVMKMKTVQSEKDGKKRGGQGFVCLLALSVLAAAGTTGAADDQAPATAPMAAIGVAEERPGPGERGGGRAEESGELPPALALEVNIDLAWESRYVSEGRDNLDGESLAGMTFQAALRGLALGGWYAASPDVDYREFNAFTAYAAEWNGIAAYLSFTHLMFLTEEEHDNEAGGGIAYTALPGDLTLGLDGCYSFEAEGCFYELCLGGEYAVQRITLAPCAALGLNSGYIADGHDGVNNFTLSIEASTPIREGLDLAVRLAYTWGIDADPAEYPGDENLKDFAYLGVALYAAF